MSNDINCVPECVKTFEREDEATESDDILTSQEAKLCTKLQNLQFKLRKCKSRGKYLLKTMKMAQNILSNKSFMELVENSISTEKILNLQSRSQNRRRRRKFTFNEQITSLSIYTQNSKVYQFLSNIFLLPESKTLDKFIQKIVIAPGIKKAVLKKLRNKAKHMWAKTRLCVLLFDEVSLNKKISYITLGNKIYFPKDEKSSPRFASHVVVFMLKGLFQNYIQPIVYAFSSEQSNAIELKKFIQIIINEVRKAGFVVVATVCKHRTNNQEVIQSLIEDTRDEKLKSGQEHKLNTFYIGKLEIIPLYDPPSLLKDFRNNLLDTPLIHENKGGEVCTAKWEHIQKLYAVNLGTKEDYRILQKLTDQHIVPGKINKIKVKFASQVFSQKVAAFMNLTSYSGVLPPECKDTALLILLIDELFDSMNGSRGRTEIEWKPLLHPLKPSPKCPHHKKWKEAKTVFHRMSLLNENNIHGPTINTYLWNIEGFEYVSRKLAQKYGISSVWTRRLNQDPLEKFLGPLLLEL